jgi:hypothetical protein
MHAERTSAAKGGGVLPFILGLAGALVLGWFVFPEVLFSQKAQPIIFNHKAHTDAAGMACADCHSFRADGSFAGIPPTAKCAECHAAPEGKPEIDKFVAEYVEKGKEVPWRVYQYQPDNVLFTHKAHEAFNCTDCHPNVGGMDKTPAYYENRLTGYSSLTMKMWQCERCHAELGVSNACHVCHK